MSLTCDTCCAETASMLALWQLLPVVVGGSWGSGGPCSGLCCLGGTETPLGCWKMLGAGSPQLMAGYLPILPCQGLLQGSAAEGKPAGWRCGARSQLESTRVAALWVQVEGEGAHQDRVILGALWHSSTFSRCVLRAAQDRLEGNKLPQSLSHC